jgi:predicted thioesterase
MKETLKPGLKMTRRIIVDQPRTIDFLDGDVGKLRVYATPSIVNDAEHACRDLVLEHFDAGEDCLGTRVEIRHLAATPVGMWVDVSVELAAVRGRALCFRFKVVDAIDTVAEGEHDRFIVDLSKVGDRLAAKMAKAEAAR